mmetsp:Transcript_9738/g.36138  ORF Transcript_9738/g.36138 Transcript_9738/m.36138 type:complete len:208 (+) Transcript_9738:1358-1981(+)
MACISSAMTCISGAIAEISSTICSAVTAVVAASADIARSSISGAAIFSSVVCAAVTAGVVAASVAIACISGPIGTISSAMLSATVSTVTTASGAIASSVIHPGGTSGAIAVVAAVVAGEAFGIFSANLGGGFWGRSGLGGGGCAAIRVRSAGMNTSFAPRVTGGAAGTDSPKSCAHSQCFTSPGAGSRCMNETGWHSTTSSMASAWA